MRGSRWATIATIVAAAAIGAACTTTVDRGRPSSDAEGAASPRPRGTVLVARSDEGLAAIDGASGALLAGGPGVIATPDGVTMFRARHGAEATTLTTIDARSGVGRAMTDVRGRYDLAVASISGDVVALVAPAPGAGSNPTGEVAMPRATTPIVVADPTGVRAPRRFRLDGNFEPEAFSIADDRLFLLQYLPAEAPAVYRVTALDLATGEVEPVTGRFRSPPERMPGVRLGQVVDADASQMYTLYSNRPGAYASGYGHGGGSSRSWPEQTFVHVLNLRAGWAYCAGLPEAMWGGAADEQSLAVSPDGRWLYVVDVRDGLIAVMDTRRLQVVRTARVVLDVDPGARTSLVVSRDGSTLFLSASNGQAPVAAIDADSLELVERWDAPIPISGLGLSLDGATLYAAGGGRLVSVDTGTGAATGTAPTSAELGSIVGLEPLPAA